MASDRQVFNYEHLMSVIKKITIGKNGPMNFQWEFQATPFTMGSGLGSRSGWLVWATFERIDVDTGKLGRGRGRDEIIWEGTSETGVVKTCWVIVDLLVRHELMHAFEYQGKSLFDPHATLDDLFAISGKTDVKDAYNFWKQSPLPGNEWKDK